MPINSFLYPGAKVTTGYDVANSLRFNGGSSDHLTRTPSSTGNRRTFTMSLWIKRSKITDNYPIMFKQVTDASNFSQFYIDNQDQLAFYVENGSGSGYTSLQITNRLFRDPSAWYHVMASVDTTQASADNRVKIYVNGVQETSFSTNTQINQNTDVAGINTTGAFGIGYASNNNSQHWNGYMAEVVFVDGTALSPTDLGEFDSDSPNIWKPINVSGLTFGTNGFYLDFENASSLGADVSGNSNNFTVNNLTSVDQSTDTCTNNFSTFNSLNPAASNTSFEQGNLTFKTDGSASGQKATFSNFGISTGKWYAEFKMTAESTQSGSFPYIGVAAIDKFSHTYIGANLDSVAFNSNQAVYSNESEIDSGETNYGDGDIVGVAADITNKKIYFHVNGTYINSQNPASGTNGYTLPNTDGGVYAFAASLYGANGTWEANFGSPSFSISSGNSDANSYGNFEYSVPSGYYALNTKNLADFG